MGFLGGAYAGPREVSYLFIDGGALRATMERFHRDFFGSHPMPAINYANVAHGFTKVFYYDCPPPQPTNDPPGVHELRLRAYAESMRKLRSLHGWHVYEGVTKRTGKKATQKEVDVLIAVDMLTHTYRRNMHRLSFLTGDQDFRPLLEALVREGMFVELRYDPSSTSEELMDAADSRQALDPYTLFHYLEAPFQQAHPMPQRSGETESLPSGAEIVRHGETVSCSPVTLGVLNNDFIIVYPDPLNVGRFQRMTHPNRVFLELVFERTIGRVKWH